MLICTIVLIKSFVKTFVLLCESIRLTSSPLYRCTILPLLKSPLEDLGADGLGCFFLVPHPGEERSHSGNRFGFAKVVASVFPLRFRLAKVVASMFPLRFGLAKVVASMFPLRFGLAKVVASMFPLRFRLAKVVARRSRFGLNLRKLSQGVPASVILISRRVFLYSRRAFIYVICFP